MAPELAVYIPLDLITEILSRLPVRSILRFKSVCKSWYALFSDPIFVGKHLKASTENKDYANHRLIFSSNYSTVVQSCPIPSVLHEEYSTAHPLNYPGRSSYGQVWIVGSVHGLVLIILDKVDLFLWNPATRESKRLPQHGFGKGSDPFHCTSYGFGYDETTSDYKIMVIKTYCKRRFKSEVKIYGLKSNSWSRFGSYHELGLLGDSGKFVSGALHWWALVETGLNVDERILTFNLSENTFSEFSIPYVGDRFLDSMDVLDGCLCVLGNFDGIKADIWVMKEYGRIESWSKMLSINIPNNIYSQLEAPSFISRKNEMLLRMRVDGDHVKLVSYNAESNTFSFPVIQVFYRISKVDTYIETLISPNYHNHIPQQ